MNLKKTKDSLPAVSNPINPQVLVFVSVSSWMCHFELKKKKKKRCNPHCSPLKIVLNVWHILTVFLIGTFLLTFHFPSDLESVNLLLLGGMNFHILADLYGFPVN